MTISQLASYGALMCVVNLDHRHVEKQGKQEQHSVYPPPPVLLRAPLLFVANANARKKGHVPPRARPSELLSEREESGREIEEEKHEERGDVRQNRGDERRSSRRSVRIISPPPRNAAATTGAGEPAERPIQDQET